MTIYAGILILFGINFLKAEIIILEKIKTTVEAIPMPTAFSTLEVTARVGHYS